MTSTQPKQKQADNLISFKDLMLLCSRRWYWFVISLFLTISLAIFYLLTTPPTYTRSAAILVQDENSSMNNAAGVFGDVDIFRTSTNINNEMQAIQSPAVMLKVVEQLNLNVNYLADGKFYDNVLYGKTLPYEVEFIGLAKNESATFTLSTANGKLHLSEFTKRGVELDGEVEAVASFTDTISTPVGKMLIKPTGNAISDDINTIYVSVVSPQSAARAYSSRLIVEVGEDSTVITISISDQNIQRAEDILNAVISVYNQNWMEDKNQIAISTSLFINERLALIEQELGNVDENIASYKSQQQLPDVQAAAGIYMSQSTQIGEQLADLNTQLSIARYIRNSLNNPSAKNQLLPANSGLDNRGIENQIQEYNTMLLRRNNLVASSSETNPLVVDLDLSLGNMRSAINASVDNQIKVLNTQLQSLQQRAVQTSALISANPTQGKALLSDERKQKVMETQYLFLLQKREENELSRAFTAYNTRVIMPPTGSMAPTAPIHNNVLLVAVALGLFIPIVIIFIRENSNTKVRGRRDLEGLSIPFVGEIPLSGIVLKNGVQTKGSRRKGAYRKKIHTPQSIVIHQGKRNIINEAFRVLRTNLEFILDADVDKARASVSAVTSFNPNSGKSFITVNTAAAFSVKGKKVLVIDSDLRYASVSSYVNSPRKGLSDYLRNKENNIKDLIVEMENYPGLYILPVGTIPPNPTELLAAPRMEVVIEQLRNDYDYIFIDCPPVDIVADTHIVEKHVDRTIFIIRAGLLEREMLRKLQSYYEENYLKNMMLVLNGTEETGGSYSYCYSYGGKSYYHTND